MIKLLQVNPYLTCFTVSEICEGKKKYIDLPTHKKIRAERATQTFLLGLISTVY